VTFDLDLLHVYLPPVKTIALMGLKVNVRGQGQTSKVKVKGPNVVGRTPIKDSFLVKIEHHLCIKHISDRDPSLFTLNATLTFVLVCSIDLY